MLLQLPPELIQLVLQHCSTQSYLQAARSCRVLHGVASSCREIILYHLRTNPGKDIKYDQLATYDLFKLLKSRTAEQLHNAIFDTDRTAHIFTDKSGNEKILDVSASSICHVRLRSHHLIAVVFKGDDSVYLCRSEASGAMKVERTIKCLLPSLGVQSVKIIKTVITPGQDYEILTVLARGQDPDSGTIADTPSVALAFAELVEQWPLQGNYFLLSFVNGDRDPSERSTNTSICRIYEHDGFRVNALAVYDPPYKFAISWEDMDENGRHEVILYSAAKDFQDDNIEYLRYAQAKCADEHGMWLSETTLSNHPEFSTLGPVTGVKFRELYDEEIDLLYTHIGGSIFGYYQGFEEAMREPKKHRAVEAYQNYFRIQHQNSRIIVSVELPCFVTHETYRDEGGHGICRWTYLAYGTTIDSSDGTTTIFLLKSPIELPATSCSHICSIDSLDRGRNQSNWELVACLCWYPQPRASSLGYIFAVSPKATRIAVSDWDKLYIWTLDPKEVIRGASSDYYPDAWCGRKTNLIHLRSWVMQQEAICFKLTFTDEDTIIMLTDRGLRTWNLGPHARRRRITSNIDVGQVHG